MWTTRVMPYLAAAAWVASTSLAVAQSRTRPTRAAPATGTLILLTDQQGAVVYIDEREVGTLPVEPQQLSPGPHTIRVAQPGYTEFNSVVEIEAGETVRVEFEIAPITAVVRVTTAPEGARIFVDGSFRAETPADLELAPGAHELRITRSGFEDAIRSIDVAAGDRATLHVELQALPEDARAAHLDARRSWYERPWTWVAVGGAAVAVAVVTVVAFGGAGGSAAASEAFCAPGCIRIQPGY